MSQQSHLISNLDDIVNIAMEACRKDAVTRLTEANFPLSCEVLHPFVTDNEQIPLPNVNHRKVQISPLHDLGVYLHLFTADHDYCCGFDSQLEPLAQALAGTALLSRPLSVRTIMPGTSGTKGMKIHWLVPMVLEYLRCLPDLRSPRPEIVERLTLQLRGLLDNPKFERVEQVPMTGVTVDEVLAHREVELRKLTDSERGLFYKQDELAPEPCILPDSNVRVSSLASGFPPHVLLSIRSSRTGVDVPASSLAQRLVLSFLLSGYQVGGSGISIALDEPGWGWNPQSLNVMRIPISERKVVDLPNVSTEQFREVVDLAYLLPEFDDGEAKRDDIVLHRALRGFGASTRNEAFLDLVIALESALLPKIRNEVSYKFKLYGSLFLKDELDTIDTFDRMHRIYKLRSDLVHGEPIKAVDRAQIVDGAHELTAAMIKRIAENGWPEPATLDKIALGHPELSKS